MLQIDAPLVANLKPRRSLRDVHYCGLDARAYMPNVATSLKSMFEGDEVFSTYKGVTYERATAVPSEGCWFVKRARGSACLHSGDKGRARPARGGADARLSTTHCHLAHELASTHAPFLIDFGKGGGGSGGGGGGGGARATNRPAFERGNNGTFFAPAPAGGGAGGASARRAYHIFRVASPHALLAHCERRGRSSRCVLTEADGRVHELPFAEEPDAEDGACSTKTFAFSELWTRVPASGERYSYLLGTPRDDQPCAVVLYGDASKIADKFRVFDTARWRLRVRAHFRDPQVATSTAYRFLVLVQQGAGTPPTWYVTDAKSAVAATAAPAQKCEVCLSATSADRWREAGPLFELVGASAEGAGAEGRGGTAGIVAHWSGAALGPRAEEALARAPALDMNPSAAVDAAAAGQFERGAQHLYSILNFGVLVGVSSGSRAPAGRAIALTMPMTLETDAGVGASRAQELAADDVRTRDTAYAAARTEAVAIEADMRRLFYTSSYASHQTILENWSAYQQKESELSSARAHMDALSQKGLSPSVERYEPHTQRRAACHERFEHTAARARRSVDASDRLFVQARDAPRAPNTSAPRAPNASAPNTSAPPAGAGGRRSFDRRFDRPFDRPFDRRLDWKTIGVAAAGIVALTAVSAGVLGLARVRERRRPRAMEYASSPPWSPSVRMP